MKLAKNEKILIATNNKGKLKEIQEILSDYELLTLNDLGIEIEVEEDQETFEGNSKKKAKQMSETSKLPCIADDSGICIESAGGWPGVHTARFLGDASQEERNQKMIEAVKDKTSRNAKVNCVISLYKNGQYLLGYGEIKGKIAERPRGDNGFGFDEIFELDNGKTLAQLSEKEKNKISARRLAIEDLKKKIEIENKKC